MGIGADVDRCTKILNNMPDGHKMEIFGAPWSSLSLFFSSMFLRFSYSLLSPTLPSIHSTIRMYNAELIDARQTPKTRVQNDR